MAAKQYAALVPTWLQEFEKEAGYMDKTEILLSPEEILKEITACYEVVDLPCGGSVEMKTLHAKSIAKAQAKKIMEWGLEVCPHWAEGNTKEVGVLKRDCSLCWRALSEEVKK